MPCDNRSSDFWLKVFMGIRKYPVIESKIVYGFNAGASLNPRIVVFRLGIRLIGAVNRLPENIAHHHILIQCRVAAASAAVAAEAGRPEGASAVATLCGGELRKRYAVPSA